MYNRFILLTNALSPSLGDEGKESSVSNTLTPEPESAIISEESNPAVPC